MEIEQQIPNWNVILKIQHCPMSKITVIAKKWKQNLILLEEHLELLEKKKCISDSCFEEIFYFSLSNGIWFES